jgi:nicotinate-nucleotide adenylyltransferase
LGPWGLKNSRRKNSWFSATDKSEHKNIVWGKGRLLERIGLYGGTFNPIHLGHLRTAWEIKEEFVLKTVVFIPSSIPPHKNPTRLENAKDRLEMIRLAIASYPELEISDIELKRSGPSYTIDTLRFFKSQLGETNELFFIIGSDAFLEINTWKSYTDLLKMVSFIVMVRPDEASHDLAREMEKINDFFRLQLSGDYSFQPDQNRYVHPERMPVYIRRVTPIQISSTRIRNLIQAGKSVAFLVPHVVLNYIQTKGLYQ